MTTPSEAGYDPGAHLNYKDICIDNPTNPTLMRVRLKASKTDPFRRGIDIYVGRTYNKLCPIEAMMAYLARRGSGEGFLFRFKDGTLLSKTRFVARVRAALESAGIDKKKYAGHSFRIGAATTASACGLSDATIKTLGRWESSAYQLAIYPESKGELGKGVSSHWLPHMNIIMVIVVLVIQYVIVNKKCI